MMIKPPITKRTRYGVAVISDKEIERFAYRQLCDFQHDYFNAPHALPIDEFVENYLLVPVSYHGLSLDNSVFGATALNDGVTSVLDSGGTIVCKEISKGEIIIDDRACKRETTIAFTLAHEAWHTQCDRGVDSKVLEIGDTIADTASDLFSHVGPFRIHTPREWMEHHANRYATYLLMPRKFIRRLWEVYRSKLLPKTRLTASKANLLWSVISRIAEDLGVAKVSIAYRLKELNLISEKQFESLKNGGKRND